MGKADHKQRIITELKNAGVSKHALHKNEVKHLPYIIHEGEHVAAAINGRTDLGSVMLVATDRRVVFLDCKMFYNTVDELTYDVVSGVACHIQGLFANVILHTRVGEYNLRFVNVKQAKSFVAFIEDKRLEDTSYASRPNQYDSVATVDGVKSAAIQLDKKQQLFLQTHTIAVLSTIDRTGNVDGAVVYYVCDQNTVYILTKSETAKARNILYHQQVAITLFEEITYETLQCKGIAEIVIDNDEKARIFERIMSLRNIQDGQTLPPVTKIHDGSYVVIRINITEANYRGYK